MSLKPLSLRAYATHRRSLGLTGGSLQAVQRAIAGERVKEAVVIVDGVKKIADPELADREWLANTDGTKAPIDPDADEDEREESPMIAALAREKHWKAESAELRFRKDAGELVSAADVQAEYLDFCTTVRNKLLGLPNRMKQAHPETPLSWLATLDTYIRESLEELASS